MSLGQCRLEIFHSVISLLLKKANGLVGERYIPTCVTACKQNPSNRLDKLLLHVSHQFLVYIKVDILCICLRHAHLHQKVPRGKWSVIKGENLDLSASYVLFHKNRNFASDFGPLILSFYNEKRSLRARNNLLKGEIYISFGLSLAKP